METLSIDRWAKELSISREAIELYLNCDVIDLHVDTFIWTRIFGYDLTQRHGRGPTAGRFFGQVDLPRIREARITGAVWSVTTQPFLPARMRARHLLENFEKIQAIFKGVPDEARLCRTADDYAQARRDGKHAVFLAIQGGNALGDDFSVFEKIQDALLRITLVHLSRSNVGNTSSPLTFLGGRRGLTDFGREAVKRLNAARIFVDLAHVSREGFWDAVKVHDPSQPLQVSHTGVVGVHDHWRNLDDEQIRAIARTGGTIGIMYQSSFLGDPVLGGKAESIVRHLEHVIQVGGEESASLGSDWDGMIVPPNDLITCLELPRLVQIMLDRKWPVERVRRVLGANFLRSLRELRP